MSMRLLFICLFIFSLAPGFSQDTIIKKNGDVISAKVTEIGMHEIKFKASGIADSPIITMDRAEVKTLKVGNQTIIEIKEEPENKVEDLIVKKDGTSLRVQVIEIGTSEIKFKLFNDPSGPVISIAKSEIKTLKVGGQTIIDVKSQKEDVILKKDGSSLKVKVLEIGSDEVRFKLYNNPGGPNLSLKKSEIKSITIDGQSVYEYTPDPYSTSHSLILNKNSSLKFHFFSPLNRHVAFSYEWMQKPGFNWEIGAGFIDRSVSPMEDITGRTPRGGFFRFGPKFLLGNSSDIEVEGARYSHPLKGRYMKIEMMLHAMNVKYTWNNSSGTPITYTKEYQSLVLNLIYGRQYILGNSITVSYYAGFGYGFESVNRKGSLPPNQWWDDWDPRRYSHLYMGKNFPMSILAGFTIGYMFPTPQLLSGSKKYNSRSGIPFDSQTTNFRN